MFKTKDEIYHNAKIKVYPNGKSKISVCSKAVYKEEGYEMINPIIKETPLKYNTDNPTEYRNLKRAKDKIFDIAFMNNFQYFATLTLDGSKVDSRTDVKYLREKLTNFLDNLVKRYDVKYLLLPEYHKDGAIHFHGLFSGNLKLVESGFYTSDHRIIYNWSQWKYGFSTVIPIVGNNEHLSKYITKYITKDCQKIFGKFYFAGGKNLIRDVPFYLADVDYDEIDEKEYTVSDVGISFKYLDYESELKF